MAKLVEGDPGPARTLEAPGKRTIPEVRGVDQAARLRCEERGITGSGRCSPPVGVVLFAPLGGEDAHQDRVVELPFAM